MNKNSFFIIIILFILFFISIFFYNRNIYLEDEIIKIKDIIQSNHDNKLILLKNTQDIIKLNENVNKNIQSNVIILQKIQELEKKNKISDLELNTTKELIAQNIYSLNKTLQIINYDKNKIKQVVDKWKKIIGKIQCKKDDDDSQGSIIIFSALLQQNKSGLLTNYHVIESDKYSGEMDKCNINFTEGNLKLDNIFLKDNFEKIDKLDAVLINEDLPVPVPFKYNICKKDLALGSNILIIGYPKVGAQNSITVTEGIISGYEDGYYITSAKIGRGNSGGAAISVDNDCYMGIPTLVMKGKVANLGRILDIRKIIDN